MSKAALIAQLNRCCFGSDDDYSTEEAVERFLAAGGEVTFASINRKPVAYLLYKQRGNGEGCIFGFRVGVLTDYRRQRLGLRLTRRVIAKARKLGLTYKTYVLVEKIASLNMHTRAGMKVSRIEPSEYRNAPWVHLTT